MKCLLMFSGGLDSCIAASWLKKKGVDVIGVHLRNPFVNNSLDNIKKIAEQINLNLHIVDLDLHYVKAMENHKFGVGRALNPCIDCRIYILNKVKNLFKFDFIATGEVLKQRPMSQKMDNLKFIEKYTNLEGKLFRPLSAKLLNKTIVEKLIPKSQMLNIQGRKRNRQFELTKKYNIKNYLQPAGGCLLTESGYCKKLADLFKYIKNYNLEDVQLLKYGRHFRLDRSLKVILSRDQCESEIFKKIRNYHFISIKNVRKSPVILIKGDNFKNYIFKFLNIIKKYSKGFVDDLLLSDGTKIKFIDMKEDFDKYLITSDKYVEPL